MTQSRAYDPEEAPVRISVFSWFLRCMLGAIRRRGRFCYSARFASAVEAITPMEQDSDEWGRSPSRYGSSAKTARTIVRAVDSGCTVSAWHRHPKNTQNGGFFAGLDRDRVGKTGIWSDPIDVVCAFLGADYTLQKASKFFKEGNIAQAQFEESQG